MSANLARVPDEQEQLSFEGLDISKFRVTLQSAGNVPCAEILHIDQHVSGRFTGNVVGITHKRGRDGELVRIQVVEALEVWIND